MLNQRFTHYFHETFFEGKEAEFHQFLESIESPLERSIRIKPWQEELVRSRLRENGWNTTLTKIDRVFTVQRNEDFDPLERRLGMNIDHLIGNFYIQELAAAHPVHILANGQIHQEPFLILDMASSPGGKTTQLAEYFPNSFIIANEPSRDRIPQLLQNLERMGTPNIGITLYPGQQWRHFPETFDRILLDAPCSGEWTLYKGTDAVKNWHLKSIKQIANLQKKLIESALTALKVWGEMIYSTCALNDIENEGILTWIRKKYGNALQITYEKKFWPHIDHTGGFFVWKIIKTASFWEQHERPEGKNSNTALVHFRKKISHWMQEDNISLYEHQGKILAVKNADIAENIREKVFFMRFWEYIGDFDGKHFTPKPWAYRYIQPNAYDIINLETEEELDKYLRGNTIETTLNNPSILITYRDIPVSIETNTWGTVSNTFPKEWRRNK